jgi:hypothetical protein
MVTARTANDRIVYFYKGDTLPEGIPQDDGRPPQVASGSSPRTTSRPID